MRRWKTAIKNLVSGFSLPVASFSYPTRKKRLILRVAKSLLLTDSQIKHSRLNNKHELYKFKVQPLCILDCQSAPDYWHEEADRHLLDSE